MRDIRFRFWDSKNKLMLSDYGVECVDINDIFGNISDDSVSAMQYTGLVDKNGSPIFEGDIALVRITIQVPDDCKTFSYFNIHEDGSKTKHCCKPKYGEVVYSDEGYIFRHSSGAKKPFWVMHGEIDKDVEIVGNIHEHPDLLEQAS